VTAAVWGVGVSWVGGGVLAAVLAVVLALAFPALVRYRSPAGEPAEAGEPISSPHEPAERAAAPAVRDTVDDRG
jgi:hypothetical protein